MDTSLGKPSHRQPPATCPEPPTETKVTLYLISGQRTLSLEADLQDTVNQIKQRIMQERKFGIVGSICLLFEDQALKGSETLAQQGVKNFSKLFIVREFLDGGGGGKERR